MSIPKIATAVLALTIVVAGSLRRPAHPASASGNASDETTTITIGTEALRTDVQHFGINLGGQNFYDSGQMLANLVSRNPGFEGETWQTILRCKTASATACMDGNAYSVWPAGFLSGAAFEVASGKAAGQTGRILQSTAATPPNGITLSFPALHEPLAAGDYLIVRAQKPGGAEAGWWTDLQGGARLLTERVDLSPDTPGKQALRIEASAPGQSATVSSYFDSTEGHSFVQLSGRYVLSFRAKPLPGSQRLGIHLSRLDRHRGRAEYFSRDLQLAPGWRSYTFSVEAHEDSTAVGTVALQFALERASVLLDDVSLVQFRRDSSNHTAFRDDVVSALRALHPGVLRCMDSGTAFGSSLDNLLQPQFARERAGYSPAETVREDIPIGLSEFLQLCAEVGADPWVSLPAGFSTAEAVNLIEYLSGPVSTPYGARRLASGRATPWTSSFQTIHLELGNEQWNAQSFMGAAMNDPVAYARRADIVFSAMRHATGFKPEQFDLIAGSWNAVPWWTAQEIAASRSLDTVAIAPYLFANFNDASSQEAIFGPMLAQPEQLDSRAAGLVAQQGSELRKNTHPLHLAVYETNLGTMTGSATQQQIESTVPSWPGGLAVADHMLLMLRDQGITTQALFCLPEFRNPFGDGTGATKRTMPLWGAVLDMGGATNRKRPTYLALQQINAALLPTMLRTTVRGADPTWDQPLSANDKVQLTGAHELQTFAFAAGEKRSVILLNLSRTQAHRVRLQTNAVPAAEVERTTLAVQNLSDSNEREDDVRPVTTTLAANQLSALNLPPASMTVLRWTQAATGK